MTWWIRTEGNIELMDAAHRRATRYGATTTRPHWPYA